MIANTIREKIEIGFNLSIIGCLMVSPIFLSYIMGD